MNDSAIAQQLQKYSLQATPNNWPQPLTHVKTADVERELARPIQPFSVTRLMALLSPAAREMLEPMAAAAQLVTRQRFGNAMNLYAPLYLSNVCSNGCLYCGFNTEHKISRSRLSIDEAVAEAEVIANEGFRDLLLVSGEDPTHVSLDYLCTLAQKLRTRFASISIEIYPLEEAGYRQLFEAGIDGVTLYQETYDSQIYADCHPTGAKSQYPARLQGPQRAAAGGMRRIGIGALLGLADWRYEALCLALHAESLMRDYWRSRVSISFPRLRPAPDVALQPAHPLSDTDMVQMMLALRLCFADIGLVLSTREPAEFRNQVLPLGITQLSAGSKTNPGGYGGAEADEQFSIADPRSAAEVADYLRSHGFDPVWKDWDASFVKEK